LSLAASYQKDTSRRVTSTLVRFTLCLLALDNGRENWQGQSDYDEEVNMAASTQDLEATFAAWTKALNTGDLNAFWEAFDEECDVLDEDFPWCMSKEDFVDHINFHAGGKGLWESFEWKPREVRFRVIGDTGHVRGFATFRGKPRDAGFRQRFMGFTHTWVRQDGKWKLICWHQSVLLGRIVGASPS
jgi:ketosteroid isomerase-like protein